MKVLIVNAYNRHNAGDAALLYAAILQVETAFPGATVSFAGLEDPAEFPDFAGAVNVGSIRRWVGDDAVSRSRRIVRKLATMALLVAPAHNLRQLARMRASRPNCTEPLLEIDALVNADLVLGLGGGYLNGAANFAGTLNVAFLLLPLVLAQRLRVQIVLAPQSYGPFGTSLQARLVRRVFNRTDRIQVREDYSVAALVAAGVAADRLERGVDSAFAITAPAARSLPPHQRVRVGITARDWLSGDAADRYESSLAEFIDWLGDDRGVDVLLIPQVTTSYRGDDDRTVSTRIAARCHSHPTLLLTQVPFDELRELYDDLDFLVGTRFHSVIFGLTSRTPAIAIEYEHKTSGIMRDLGLGEWVIPIGAVDLATLQERYLAIEARREEYVRRLDEVLPAYQDRALDFVAVMRDATHRGVVRTR